jgi:outer membrane protein
MFRSIRFLIAVATLPAGALAQAPGGRSLSLDEAMRLAMTQSEAVRVAEAGVLRARGQQMQVKSQLLPQVSASAGYTRTLASQFEVLQNSQAPTPPPGTPPVPPADSTSFFQPCTRYLAGPLASDAARVAGLESFAKCTQSGGTGGIDFSRVGFGSENQYQFGLQGSLLVFSGGRVQSQNRAAAAGRRSADIELLAQRAKVYLDVAEAYLDAVLADRLVAIAESSLVQTEGALRQTQLARQVGNQSEFELLRAQVSRGNQTPLVIQRRTTRDIAYLRLKQLLNIPFTQNVVLSTELADGRQLMAVAQAGGVPVTNVPDTSAGQRAPVRQLEEAVTSQQAALRVARSEWWPQVTLSSQYGRVAYPATGIPGWQNFLTNWTVNIGATIPLYSGGRIKGSTLVAEANLREARARLDQTRELASLDAQQAIAQLAEAEATFQASAGTAEQATKAYSIAEVRYREGLSTQLELTDSRLLLMQASANRAQAIRDVQVARIRLALLRDLPLGAGGGNTLSPQFPAGGTNLTLPQIAPGFIGPTPTRGAASQASTQVVPP